MYVKSVRRKTMADDMKFSKYRKELDERVDQRKKTDNKNRKVIATIEVEFEVPYDQTEREKVLYKLYNLFLNTELA